MWKRGRNRNKNKPPVEFLDDILFLIDGMFKQFKQNVKKISHSDENPSLFPGATKWVDFKLKTLQNKCDSSPFCCKKILK